jgi:hypothetical protein
MQACLALPTQIFCVLVGTAVVLLLVLLLLLLLLAAAQAAAKASKGSVRPSSRSLRISLYLQERASCRRYSTVSDTCTAVLCMRSSSYANGESVQACARESSALNTPTYTA